MNYLDSNLVLYAILDEKETGEWARGILGRIQKGQMTACTSFLTFDEVFYKVNNAKGTDAALKNLEAFLTMQNMKFLDVNDSVIWNALGLIREHKLFPRDAIHAATAILAGAENIYSQDADFDGLKGLNRKWM